MSLVSVPLRCRWHRRPMLAIIGGTNLGKSLLAASVLRELGKILGVDGFLEITVEQNPNLDLCAAFVCLLFEAFFLVACFGGEL